MSLSSRAKIRGLNLLDLDETPYEIVLEMCSELFVGLKTTMRTNGGAELLFRSRVNPSIRPSKVDELGAPPAEAVTGFQRCNAPGNPMFYAASKRRTALLESRAKKGDIVYLSQWIGRESYKTNNLLIASDDEIDAMDDDGKGSIIYSFMDSMFTKRIHSDFSNDYKISAALSERMTTGFPDIVGGVERNDGKIAIRYPSVFDKKKSYNTCFHAETAENKLRPLHVMEAVVVQSHGMHIDIRVMDTAFSFQDGKIEWTGSPHRLPAMRGEDGSVLLRSDGKEWLAAVLEDVSSEVYLRNLLLE